jgi:sporulation protein YhbH
MENEPPRSDEPSDGGKGWYDLFSRGARDWLRHNDKVSEAVRQKLPELISNLDVLGPRAESTVRVPVKFLEHYRFRLRDDGTKHGVGQGEGNPGDTIVQRQPEQGEGKGEGGTNQGGFEFVLELKIDDIVDWLWEELELPHLERKEGRLRDADYKREGWNRRGARSRLDRRRSVKEAIKRRLRQQDGPAFTDEDLRFRQLVLRTQPSTEAVVFFAMDVSSSMTETDRRLSKTFFFWVVQGLRRQYAHIEPIFVAHTVDAWEFAEDEFFQVSGSGGTVASTAFNKTLEIIDQRFDPGRYNIYLFYASDGANFSNDAGPALTSLRELQRVASFMGYVETTPQPRSTGRSETARLFAELESDPADDHIGTYELHDSESVWNAIRAFFTQQSQEADGAP